MSETLRNPFLTVREAARKRLPLDGVDSEALEHALTQCEAALRAAEELTAPGEYDNLLKRARMIGKLFQQEVARTGAKFAPPLELEMATAIEQLQARVRELEAELERERVRLAGCGVAASSNTREALERNRLEPGSYGHSASYDDCLRAAEREINERERREQAEARLADLRVHTLMAYRDPDGKIVSAWKPDADDLKALNEGAHVLLHVFGGVHPPVALTVQRMVEKE